MVEHLGKEQLLEPQFITVVLRTGQFIFPYDRAYSHYTRMRMYYHDWSYSHYSNHSNQVDFISIGPVLQSLCQSFKPKIFYFDIGGLTVITVVIQILFQYGWLYSHYSSHSNQVDFISIGPVLQSLRQSFKPDRFYYDMTGHTVITVVIQTEQILLMNRMRIDKVKKFILILQFTTYLIHLQSFRTTLSSSTVIKQTCNGKIMNLTTK